MKAMATFKGLTRGDSGDTLRFSDDAPHVLQPAGGVKSVRWEPCAGRLTIESGNKQVAEVVGELRRVDSWAMDADSGEVEASASITFACEARLHGHEVAALLDAPDGLRLTFKPAQGKLAFGKQEAA